MVADEQSRELLPLIQRRYEAMAADPAYVRAPSSLPYCFGVTRPHNGRATIFLPGPVSANTRMIVFLHGYGGSFLWYMHYLSEQFPDRVIVCPAFGLSGGGMTSAYVREAVSSVRKELKGTASAPPDLVGLSAGGFAASQIYAESAGEFGKLVVLAAYPPKSVERVIAALPGASFVAGGNELFVTNGAWQRLVSLRSGQTMKGAEFSIIPDAGHFFMLTHPKETAQWLKGRLNR